nr:exopolysaccharide biosynthesis polyprenyl glycosylphosphotransferase [Sphingomonas sp.]
SLLVPSFFLLRATRDSYSRSFATVAPDATDVIFDAIVSVLLTTALVWMLGAIGDYSRGITLLYLAFFTTALWLSRPALRWYLRRLAKQGVISQRIVFYGADAKSIEAMQQLLASLDLPHLSFVGVIDDRPRVRHIGDLPFLGGSEQLAALARRGEVDQVLITVADLNRQRLDEIVENLSTVSVDVSLIPSQAIDLAPDYRVRLLGPVPVLTMWLRPFRDINRFLKRAEDLIVATTGVVLLSPLLLVTALLIKLTSRGPILFVQPRVGFNNEIINVLKFRSMYAEHSDLHAAETTTRDDRRVTYVGRWIRRLSIDELPQLLNVLAGSMSVVGPRPHATQMKVEDRYYVDAVQGYAGRHRVKPGITGLAQVRGLRGEIRTIERAKRRVELDKEYIDRWSIALDLWILVLTLRAVLFDNDAY